MRSGIADPKTLKPNPWNPNVVSPENERKLDESIQRNGFFKPILVRETPDGELQIIGGAHRVQSAIRLKIPQVPIWNVGRIDDKRAKEIALIDNARYGADDAIALADILAEIGDPEDISSFLPYTDTEIAAIFASTDIALDALGDMDDEEEKTPPPPKAPRTHTIMRFKVPIEDAEKIGTVLESIMRRHGFTKSDALTNAGDALVWAMNKAQKEEAL